VTAIRIAYIANILILVPIAIPTLFKLFPTDQSRFENSAGWRTIVGSFWLAILIVSVLGIFSPLAFSGVLVVQLIYKFCWLLIYAIPRMIQGRRSEVPSGIALSFLIMVVIWPMIIPWHYLFSTR
jgi:hypothetical protein